MTETIVVDRRYRGPDQSGNGGWSAGLVASALGGPAEVTLRMPPPLDTPLEVRRTDAGVTVHHGGRVVAEGVPGAAGIEAPRVVSLDEARAATRAYGGFTAHLFPGCFTCGPERAEGDGLRIFPGPVQAGPVEAGLVAAPWTPHASVADDDATVSVPAVWAALDCPGAWGSDMSAGRPAVLGRLAVDIRRRPRTGEQLVVLGWAIEDLPKKFLAGSALQTADGEVLAVGLATWVRIPLDWQG
ncbi:MAG TPA: hypothetical protein VNB94_13040 [Mycobacteriales bacterium]|nr:hypothetical protein [Mycobacteriales bacterium]